MRKSWAQLDEERANLQKNNRKFTRAEFARRCGVSESTITKGLSNNSHPYSEARKQAELVLNMEKLAQEQGVAG